MSKLSYIEKPKLHCYKLLFIARISCFAFLGLNHCCGEMLI